MQPTTFQALAVVAAAVLPGASFVWGFERSSNWQWGANLGDRLLYFIAAAAVFHVAAGWPEYLIWRSYFRDIDSLDSGAFALIWIGFVAAILIPGAIGWFAGSRWRSGRYIRQVRRGWDGWTSAVKPNSLVRVRVGSPGQGGAWVGGLYGEFAAAGVSPNPNDLYLDWGWRLDEEGNFLGDELGDYGVYIPSDKIQWIEVIYRKSDLDA